ncbi:MAG TPA: hypothetical protein V6D07_18850 [Trichocoleus sp.]
MKLITYGLFAAVTASIVLLVNAAFPHIPGLVTALTHAIAILLGLFVGSASKIEYPQILQVWSNLKDDIRGVGHSVGLAITHLLQMDVNLNNRLDRIEKTMAIRSAEEVDEELSKYIEQLERNGVVEDADRPYHGLLGLACDAIATLCDELVDDSKHECHACGSTNPTLSEHPYLAAAHQPRCSVPTALNLVNELRQNCLKQAALTP